MSYAALSEKPSSADWVFGTLRKHCDYRILETVTVDTKAVAEDHTRHTRHLSSSSRDLRHITMRGREPKTNEEKTPNR